VPPLWVSSVYDEPLLVVRELQISNHSLPTVSTNTLATADLLASTSGTSTLAIEWDEYYDGEEEDDDDDDDVRSEQDSVQDSGHEDEGDFGDDFGDYIAEDPRLEMEQE